MASPCNCFSGILRSRAHPPDAIAGGSKTDQKCGSTATPGIVARLMGLESFPETDHSVRRRTTLESILRSRSVNSIDYIPEFDLFQTHQHKRAKTLVSFREFPTFLDEPSYDLFLSCLEGLRDRRNAMSLSLSLTKSEMGLEEKRKAIKTERNRGGDNKSKVVKNRNKKCAVSMKSETVNTARMLREKSSRKEEEEGKTMMKSRDVGYSDWSVLAKGFVGFEEEVEGICNEFGQKLLDDMLQKIVDEFDWFI